MGTAAEYARRRLGDALYEVMLYQTGPTRASFILHELPRSSGFTAAAAREALETDPRFAEADGRFDLVIRDKVSGQNFNSAVVAVLEDLGRAAPEGALAAFFGGLTHRDADYYTQLFQRLSERGDVLALLDGRVISIDWLLFPDGENEDDVLFFCNLEGNEELQLYRPFLSDESLRGETPLETAVNMVSAAGDEISNRILGFFVYRLHPQEFDPLALLRDMLADERVFAAPGLRWLPGEVREQVDQEVKKLNQAARGSEPVPVLDVDLATLLNEPLPADHPGYYIEDNDLTMIYQVVHESPEPVSIEKLLFDVLELFPDDADFLPAAHSIYGLLHEDPSIIDVDLVSFAGRAALPAWVHEVPEVLIPRVSSPQDVVLSLEGLDNGLAAKIHDAYHEDVMDDDVVVTADMKTVDETVYTLPPHHLEAGTMRLRKMDRSMFRVSEAAAPAKFMDSEGNAVSAWINADTNLILGLGDLYANLGVQAGDVISITAGEEAMEFVVEPAGEDESWGLTPQRLTELQQMRTQAQADGWSLFKALCEVMTAFPEGMEFDAAFGQVNVIKRATRLQVASLLSYYLCFRPADETGEAWIFAPRAVNAGTVQTKNRYIIKDWGAAV